MAGQRQPIELVLAKGNKHFKTQMKILKKIFCRHDFIYIRKLYGDEINLHDGKRNEYRCKKCGIYKWM